MAKLHFTRITSMFQFNEIPKYLFEQMKHKTFDLERMYAAMFNIIRSTKTWFYQITSDDKIVGALWATVEPVANVVMINFLTVDPEYQGRAIGKAVKVLLKEARETGVKEEIVWANIRHKALTRLGWESTGRVVMKYTEK